MNPGVGGVYNTGTQKKDTISQFDTNFNEHRWLVASSIYNATVLLLEFVAELQRRLLIKSI